RTHDVELADLGEQAFQSDTPWISLQPRECCACPVIGEQGIEAASCLGIEAYGDHPKRPFVMRRARRRDEPIETVGTGTDDTVAGEPGTDLLLQSRRAGLARQRLLGEPGPERCISLP